MSISIFLKCLIVGLMKKAIFGIEKGKGKVEVKVEVKIDIKLAFKDKHFSQN